LERNISEIFDGISYVEQNAPNLERNIRALIDRELNSRQGIHPSSKILKDMMRISKKWNDLVKKLRKKYPNKSKKEILRMAKKQYGKEEEALNNSELFSQKELIELHNRKVRRTRKKIDELIGI